MIPKAMTVLLPAESYCRQNMNKWLQGQVKLRKGRKLNNEKVKWFITGLEHLSLFSKTVSKVYLLFYDFMWLVSVHHCFAHLLSLVKFCCH